MAEGALWLPTELWCIVLRFVQPASVRRKLGVVCKEWSGYVQAHGARQTQLCMFGNLRDGRQEPLGRRTDVRRIASADEYTIAITLDREVFHIQCDRSKEYVTTVTVPPDYGRAAEVVASTLCFLILTDTGRVLYYKQSKNLQATVPIEKAYTPGQVYKYIACNEAHVFIATDQAVYGVGSNSYGQLGMPEDTRTGKMECIDFFNGMQILGLNAGMEYILVQTDQGVYGLGSSAYGQLGHSNKTHVHVPTLLSSTLQFKIHRIVTGAWHVLLLTEEGKLYAWGNNYWGKLGYDGSDNDNLNTPVRVILPPDVKFVHVSAGVRHSTAIDDKGQVYMWGCNEDGQGARDNTSRRQPVPVLSDLVPEKALLTACGKAQTTLLLDVTPQQRD
eukprot:TRINITY_DN4729_c0_g1_i1.p1 TRINITY_DN4729_c0_g1~~TRINITY_DN4729_c0_g1_i1.p1  ORF type:complete len:388 (+),score=28.04 TRINITY_DN4729_c0_g1_i1:297-1460(+)